MNLKIYLVKKYVYLSIILCFTSSCSYLNNTPKCNNEQVMKLAKELSGKQFAGLILYGYDTPFNEEDIQAYAKSHNLNLDTLYTQQRASYDSLRAIYKEKVIQETDLKNIRTKEIKDDVKLCTCEAEIQYPKLGDIHIIYSAQTTENQDHGVYVKLFIDKN